LKIGGLAQAIGFFREFHGRGPFVGDFLGLADTGRSSFRSSDRMNSRTTSLCVRPCLRAYSARISSSLSGARIVSIFVFMELVPYINMIYTNSYRETRSNASRLLARQENRDK
jgi:hypothetical protein